MCVITAYGVQCLGCWWSEVGYMAAGYASRMRVVARRFGHFYAYRQELETICVLLRPVVCDALVAGGRRSGAGQQAMRSG